MLIGTRVRQADWCYVWLANSFCSLCDLIVFAVQLLKNLLYKLVTLEQLEFIIFSIIFKFGHRI